MVACARSQDLESRTGENKYEYTARRGWATLSRACVAGRCRQQPIREVRETKKARRLYGDVRGSQLNESDISILGGDKILG